MIDEGIVSGAGQVGNYVVFHWAPKDILPAMLDCAEMGDSEGGVLGSGSSF